MTLNTKDTLKVVWNIILMTMYSLSSYIIIIFFKFIKYLVSKLILKTSTRNVQYYLRKYHAIGVCTEPFLSLLPFHFLGLHSLEWKTTERAQTAHCRSEWETERASDATNTQRMPACLSAFVHQFTRYIRSAMALYTRHITSHFGI